MNNINEHELISAANHVELNFRHMGLTEPSCDIFRHPQWEIEEYRETAPDSVERLHEAVDIAILGLRLVNSLVKDKADSRAVNEKCETVIDRVNRAYTIWRDRKNDPTATPYGAYADAKETLNHEEDSNAIQG